MLCSPVQRPCQSKCNVVIFVKTELLHSITIDCTCAPNEEAAECVCIRHTGFIMVRENLSSFDIQFCDLWNQIKWNRCISMCTLFHLCVCILYLYSIKCLFFGLSPLEWTWAYAWLKHSYSRRVSVTLVVQPLGNVRSFSPTDNCDCLDPDLPRNASHRWRERENTEVGWWRVDFAISYRPRHNRALNISSVGWCVLGDMFVGLHECECILRVRVSSECVSQRIMQPAEAT